MDRFLVLLTLLAIFVDTTLGRDAYHPTRRGLSGDDDDKVDAGRADAAELDPRYWAAAADEALAQRLRAAAAGGEGRARNVILFLGDGMSLATLSAARALRGQLANRTGEEAALAFDTFPTVGLAKTYCVDAQTADSACSATAYLCGVKTNLGTLGLGAAVRRGACDVTGHVPHRLASIAAWALADQRDAGIVTTTRVTHASPAGAFSHSADRHWESDADVSAACPDTAPDTRQPDIARQLVHSFPGNQFKVILGGGRREFLPNTTIDEEGAPGRREDGRNLIAEWVSQQQARGRRAQYAWHRQDLLAAIRSPPDALLGLFASSHLPYSLEADPHSEPTLAELTEAAIRVLSRNPRGFFLFVEGGRIDHAHHENKPRLALTETLQLSEAVALADRLLPPDDTLILVTSDHAHVMAYNGYARRGSDILGPSGDTDAQGVPYMTLSYTNGPGFRPHAADGVRDDITRHNYQEAQFQYEAGIPLESETHGGEDVAVFARGPQHALFGGVLEQSDLPRRAAAAACLRTADGAGDGRMPLPPACHARP